MSDDRVQLAVDSTQPIHTHTESTSHMMYMSNDLGRAYFLSSDASPPPPLAAAPALLLALALGVGALEAALAAGVDEVPGTAHFFTPPALVELEAVDEAGTITIHKTRKT